MKTIKSRIIFGFLTAIMVLAITTITFVALSMRNNAENAYTTNSTRQLRLMNNNVSSLIDIAARDVAVIAKNPDIARGKGMFPSFASTARGEPYQYSQLSAEALKVAQYLARLDKEDENYVEVYVGYSDSGFVTSLDGTTLLAGYDPTKRSWYQEQRGSASPYGVAESYLSYTNELVFAVTHKLLDDHSSLAGVASIDISLTGLSESFRSSNFGDTGYFLLIENTGRVLCDPKHSDFIGKIVNKEIKDPGMIELFEKKDGIASVSIKGVDMLANVVTNAYGWKTIALQAESEIFASSNAAIRSVVTISFVVVLAVLALAFFIARSINTPLNRLVVAADQIARGDLDTQMSGQGFYGELADLHNSLTNMVSNLQQMITKAEQKSDEAKEQTRLAEQATADAEAARVEAEKGKRDGMLAAAAQLEDVVAAISSASVELSAQLEQTNAVASESASQLTHAANAMNEMNTAVREVSRNSSQASEMSHDTRKNAEEGDKIVQQALQSIDHVHSVSIELKEVMALLDGHAQAITAIMGVISDIADQTNLLALNAAIEAARAGDAGRGFAVVADEVRKLAEKTTSSTQDVGDAIRAIQKSTTESVASVDNALQQAKVAADFAKQSGEALRGIVSNAISTADQVRNIATASEEQSANCEEINAAIVHINDISKQTAKTMDESFKAVENLTQQTYILSGLIKRMQEQ